MNQNGMPQFHGDLDAFAERFALFIVEHGRRQELTREHLRQRILHYLEVGKQDLEACGPDQSPYSSGFVSTVTIFGPGGEEANCPVPFRDAAEKRARMRGVSETCKIVLAQAVIFRTVATMANMAQIAAAMHLNAPDPRDNDRQKVDYFEQRMWNWIERNYGEPRLAALPPEFRKDSLVVSAMGPRVPDLGAGVEYEWRAGKLIFDDHGGETTDMEHCSMRLNLIPRWWQ